MTARLVEAINSLSMVVLVTLADAIALVCIAVAHSALQRLVRHLSRTLDHSRLCDLAAALLYSLGLLGLVVVAIHTWIFFVIKSL